MIMIFFSIVLNMNKSGNISPRRLRSFLFRFFLLMSVETATKFCRSSFKLSRKKIWNKKVALSNLIHSSVCFVIHDRKNYCLSRF